MKFKWSLTIATAVFGAAIAGAVVPLAVKAEQAAAAPEVSFTKDIAPILQRSCQNCHRPGQVAPMSLLTYEDARPWARSMKARTAIRDKAGAMPPWYIEKNIGIQHYKNDPSLSDEEVAKIAKWADSGAPRGNPADMPPPRTFPDGASWHAGQPDLIIESPEITVKANAPDWWGEFPPTKIPITEDRYVASVEIREVNNFSNESGRQTVGQRYVWHHLIWATAPVGEDGDPLDASIGEGAVGWPVHEVGRNADIFDANAGRLLKAGSSIIYQSAHLHSGGADVKSKLLFGFKFHPVGYKPAKRTTLHSLANALDIDIKPNEANQQLHAYEVLQQPAKIVTFEPHLHAPGQRMCLEAIWGYTIQTLTCAGYDHNWVRQYRVRRRLRADSSAWRDPSHHRLHGQHAEQQEHSRPAQLAGLGKSIDREHVHRPWADHAVDRRRVPAGDGEAPRAAGAESARCHHRVSALQRDTSSGKADNGNGEARAVAVQSSEFKVQS